MEFTLPPPNPYYQFEERSMNNIIFYLLLPLCLFIFGTLILKIFEETIYNNEHLGNFISALIDLLFGRTENGEPIITLLALS